jgi:hypothetical protein
MSFSSAENRTFRNEFTILNSLFSLKLISSLNFKVGKPALLTHGLLEAILGLTKMETKSEAGDKC